MKKFILIPFLALFSFAASAQYYQDSENPDLLRHDANPSAHLRNEFILPQVLGYNVYKADLHTHTIFSDGIVNPLFRVQEAWFDGLDVLAVTDHIEYRPREVEMLGVFTTKSGEKIDKENLTSDYNYPVVLTQRYAREYGITIIPGTEITRDGRVIGHYNALFTTDNNKIYDNDPLQALKNAKAQGALILHNHPGWVRKNLDILEFEQKAYDEGLIDGIEIMNGSEFYPKAIDRALKYNFFMSANTDVHASTAETYKAYGNTRNMTFILAKDTSLESLREALDAKRTLAYSFGTVAGPKELLKALFEASIDVRPIGGERVLLVNNTSLVFILQGEKGNKMVLKPFTSMRIYSKEKKVTYTVENFWISSDEKLKVDIKL